MAPKTSKTNRKAKGHERGAAPAPHPLSVIPAIGTRGRAFEGFVTKKFPTRVVVAFERTVYVKKYQRFYKKKTRLHARLPQSMHVEIGDYIRVRECRPLSKIIRFVVIEKIRAASEMAGKVPAVASAAPTNEKKEMVKEAKA